MATTTNVTLNAEQLEKIHLDAERIVKLCPNTGTDFKTWYDNGVLAQEVSKSLKSIGVNKSDADVKKELDGFVVKAGYVFDENHTSCDFYFDVLVPYVNEITRVVSIEAADRKRFLGYAVAIFGGCVSGKLLTSIMNIVRDDQNDIDAIELKVRSINGVPDQLKEKFIRLMKI